MRMSQYAAQLCVYGTASVWASRADALLLQGAKGGACDEEQGRIKSPSVFGMALT